MSEGVVDKDDVELIVRISPELKESIDEHLRKRRVDLDSFVSKCIQRGLPFTIEVYDAKCALYRGR